MSGETESLKTWFALILSKAEMDAGYTVAWADLDAMGSGELLARLQALGVADDVIGKRFLYYEPAERLINEVLEDVTGDIVERGIRLFVIDAFNPMLSLHGLDPNSTPDIESVLAEIADPICRAGAAPICSTTSRRTRNIEVRVRERAEGVRRDRPRRFPAPPRSHSWQRRPHAAHPPQRQARLPAVPEHRPADPRLGRRERRLQARGRRESGRTERSARPATWSASR